MDCLDQEAQDASGTSSDRLQVPPYRHEPLKDPRGQIRVLVLLPATEFDDDIHCRLQVVAASDESYGEYEALSYAWGDTTLTHEIFIEGYRLGVTRNLDIALRHLRYPEHEQLLWIDAICINQTDDHEKSHQVQVLSRTFRRAKRLLVWLGPGNDDTDYVMQHLVEAQRNNPPSENELDSRWRGVWADFDDEPALWDGLSQIFCRPWWSRVWTLAEILVAESIPLIGCGRYWIWHNYLLHSPILLRRVHQASRLASLRVGGSMPRDVRSVSYLLGLGGHCRATDPRDHVFAITGLFADVLPQSVLPDYGISVGALFQCMTVLLLSERVSLHPVDFSCFPRGHGRTFDFSIPSWCINFCEIDRADDNSGESYIVRDLREPGAALAAYGSLEPFEMKQDFDRGFLMLDGIIIGVADCVLPPVNTFETLHKHLSAQLEHPSTELQRATIDDLRAAMRSWTKGLLTFRGRVLHRLQLRMGTDEVRATFASGSFWQSLMGGETLLSAISRFYWAKEYKRRNDLLGHVQTNELWVRSDHTSALAAASSPGSRCSLSEVQLENAFTKALSTPNDAGLPVADHLLNGLSDDALEALAHFAFRAGSYTSFVTDTGYLGRASARARKDDHVLILSRLAYPVILRPRADGFWHHVSFAYVQGIMEGEFVRDHGKLERQEFWLC